MGSLTWRKVALLGALGVALYTLATLDVQPQPAGAAPLAQATATNTPTVTNTPTNTATPGPAAVQLGGVPIYAPHASGGNNLLGVSCENGCSGGSSFPYGAGTPVPVSQQATPIVQVVGTLPPLAAGEAFVGKVGGSTLHPSANPVLTVAATYVSGDYVGTSTTPWSWTACRTSGGSFQIQSMTVVDKAAQSVAGEVWLFDRSVTVPADSAAWTITDADAQFLIGVIPTGTYYASAANSVSVTTGVGMTGWCNSGTSVFGAFVTRGSPAYATGDLTVLLGLVTD